MTPETELDYLRDLVDTQQVQITALQEHLDHLRAENLRLVTHTERLEVALDNKNGEISRLTQIAQGLYGDGR